MCESECESSVQWRTSKTRTAASTKIIQKRTISAAGRGFDSDAEIAGSWN